MTVLSNTPSRQTSTDVPYHPAYSGKIFFKNTFDGKLPATDYPKVNVRNIRPGYCVSNPLTSELVVLSLDVLGVYSPWSLVGLVVLYE